VARDGIRRCCATGGTTGGGVRAFQINDRLRLADASMVSTLEAVRVCLIFLGSAVGRLEPSVGMGHRRGAAGAIAITLSAPTSGSTKRRSRLRLMPWSDFARWPITKRRRDRPRGAPARVALPGGSSGAPSSFGDFHDRAIDALWKARISCGKGDRGCVKTQAFNLRVEIPSRFRQSKEE
jgi:hypothetical protein